MKQVIASKLHRRVLQSLLVSCFTLIVSTSFALAQSSLTGYWNLKVPNEDGTFRNTYFQLEQSGDKLSGKLFGRNIQGTALQGTVNGDVIHLETIPPVRAAGAPPNDIQYRAIVFEGKIESDKMALENVNRKIKGMAERTTKEAATPPAPLPLPQLRDVPDNGLARTPPMGWNSWNKFAGKVTAADVRGMAEAIVATGMDKLGYVYVNIDDTWEAGRDAQGNITTNRKFPDMKALADYVHSKGLKIGIYSSPGSTTCAGYEGSFGHEVQDAKMFAAWGIDYLKYDLCGARTVYTSTEANHRGLYQKMGEALQQSGRPIVYSLCQYGENDPWKWGTKVGGNLWRTTGDITDKWESMDRIGFSQIAISSYTRPGHWNDPDMLEIGNGGMTGDEYRTHMSLWAMLAAPLIAGNDLRSMTDETKSILMNREVIAVDQDAAAKSVQSLSTEGTVETLWRPMADGTLVIGIFNRGAEAATSDLQWSKVPGLSGKKLQVRDLWQHSDLNLKGDQYTAQVPKHGVVLLRVRVK
jgi:alpha-galactosidase